jgi:hypothetical protein
MRIRNISVLFIISMIISKFAFAQQAVDYKDSSQLYKHIETFSKKTKLTKLIYPLVFISEADIIEKKVVKRKGQNKQIKKPYSPFEGKIIRKINIESLDPFGFSISDTLAAPHNFLIKTGNSLHIKSKQITIRNLLLIRQNQVFDSLLVTESERLVRSMSYVRDVSFTIKATSQNSDSVDIFIRELDNWSIIADIGGSTSQLNFKLTDKNFLGLGHVSQNSLTWFHAKGDYAYHINYFIPNIRNSYINSGFSYGTDEFRNFIKTFTIDRPFFSPFAKWAAGVRIEQKFLNDSVLTSDLVYIPQIIKFNTQDYWAGFATQIFKGNTEYSRTTNLISTFRFLRIRYLQKPTEDLDPLNIYSDENFYLVGIGISTRKYVQDKFIFRYGVTEDVPVGKVYSLTAGYQIKNNTSRLYLGARLSFGNYYSWGFFSSILEYGTFFRSFNVEQGIFSASLNYFTGLIEIGKWKFRQFIKPQISIGINRFAYDSLTINDGYGLDGFNSPALSGTRRILFAFQTQSYSPWKLMGFRFGPYLICSLGMLGNATNGFKNSKVYSQIGFGVLIKNESFVFNTFQISIAFYPKIPGTGNDVFKVNSFRTTDFGFRNFEIGKPSNLVFQ